MGWIQIGSVLSGLTGQGQQDLSNGTSAAGQGLLVWSRYSSSCHKTSGSRNTSRNNFKSKCGTVVNVSTSLLRWGIVIKKPQESTKLSGVIRDFLQFMIFFNIFLVQVNQPSLRLCAQLLQPQTETYMSFWLKRTSFEEAPTSNSISSCNGRSHPPAGHTMMGPGHDGHIANFNDQN